MQPDKLTIRRPTATFRERKSAPTFNLNKPIKGMKVGIRTDQFWRSWLDVADVWSELLKKDGATPVILRVGEHTGAEGQHTKELVDAWAGSVDCAVVGLAN